MTARPVFFHLPELVADGKTCYLQDQGATADIPTGNHAYTLYAEFKTTAAKNMGIIGYGPRRVVLKRILTLGVTAKRSARMCTRFAGGLRVCVAGAYGASSGCNALRTNGPDQWIAYWWQNGQH